MSIGVGADVRALDFSDDRLSAVLDYLSQDEEWETFEVGLNHCILRVYDLKAKRVRVDSTTAKAYVGVSDGGLFQFGHSKDHRPDLPQLKINQSALDPLGIPVTTTVVSGNKADDPLYIPEIRKVQRSLGSQGVLYVGDCKMSSLETRAYVAKSGDYYLSPLSSVQVSEKELQHILLPVWDGKELESVYRPMENDGDEAECVAEGFVYIETIQTDIDGEQFEWQEQRVVVRSFKYAERQEKELKERLKKAESAIASLNLRGRGRKELNADELSEEVNRILARYRVNGILEISYQTQTRQIEKRRYKDRDERVITETEITVNSERNLIGYQDVVRNLGWRVYVSNDLELTLSESVMAYRSEYLIEHNFARLKGKTLGLTPIYINDDDRVKGLVRLLSIGLRIICLLEFSVRKALKESGEKLSGIYKGNPKRATARPTTEMMLTAFENITLNEVNVNGVKHLCLTPLKSVQERILKLMGFTPTIYLVLTG